MTYILVVKKTRPKTKINNFFIFIVIIHYYNKINRKKFLFWLHCHPATATQHTMYYYYAE